MLGSRHDSFNGADFTLLSSGASCFAKSDALPGPVLFDELDAGSLEGVPYRRFIGERDRNLSINDFDPADRCDSDLGCSG
jgi:hypothetical protein